MVEHFQKSKIGVEASKSLNDEKLRVRTEGQILKGKVTTYTFLYSVLFAWSHFHGKI